MTNNGNVIEVHTNYRAGSLDNAIYDRFGRLNGEHGSEITWSDEAEFDYASKYPTISTNGVIAIQSHEDGNGIDTFYSTSAPRDRSNWMADMWGSIGNKTLGEIVVPGSHDAGMYKEPPAEGGIARTQDETIYQQLQGGVRYFDLRVKGGTTQRIHHGSFTGPAVSEVLDDVKKFMMEKHKEVVVLKFSHFLNFQTTKDSDPYGVLVKAIQDSLDAWLYKTSSYPARVPLSDIVTDESGKVLIVVDGGYAQTRSDAGFFVYRDWCADSEPCSDDGKLSPKGGQCNVYDQYSKTESYDKIKNGQLENLKSYNGKMKNDQSLECDLLLLSWTLTPVLGTDVVRITQPANRNLGNAMNSVNANETGLYPNIVYVDYYEKARVTDTAIIMNQRFLNLNP